MTTAPSPPLLRVTGLHKQFGDNAIIKGIDLSVAPGDRIAILGASGSGKSTLLRCLNFMEKPTSGRVELGGALVGTEKPQRDGSVSTSYTERELTAVRQRVGMVFQQFNLFPHMTALGNVMEGLRTVNASRLPVRWPWSPNCCCSTNPPRHLTRNWWARCCA